ncbi:MAG: DUF5913 domain-containing protein, partial [Bacilli bacterium]|nr:DUF5913 domain-containing protein [Bacilli bacterium]
KIDKDDNIKRGEEKLLKELRKKKLTSTNFLSDDNINHLIETLNMNSLNDIYHALGSSKFKANYIVNLVTKDTKSKEEIVLDKLSAAAVNVVTSKNDVLVDGIDEIKVTLANCCMPIKGDDIMGYITKGSGITVHRINCHNIATTEERLINVEWNNNIDKKWPTNIVVEAERKDNLLLELISKTTLSDTNIQAINTMGDNDYVIYDIIVSVASKEKLEKLINDIEQMPSVHKVERVIK